MRDGDKLLELSIKCQPEDGFVGQKAFEGFLADRRLDAHDEQQTKTKTAMEGLARHSKAG